MSDLIERLRNEANTGWWYSSTGEEPASLQLMRDAADRLVEARELLRVLAEIPLEDFGKQNTPMYPLMGWNNHTLYVGHVLAARAFLAATTKETAK